MIEPHCSAGPVSSSGTDRENVGWHYGSRIVRREMAWRSRCNRQPCTALWEGGKAGETQSHTHWMRTVHPQIREVELVFRIGTGLIMLKPIMKVPPFYNFLEKKTGFGFHCRLKVTVFMYNCTCERANSNSSVFCNCLHRSSSFRDLCMLVLTMCMDWDL